MTPNQQREALQKQKEPEIRKIVVGTQHVGNVFSGQFFFEGEPLDYELFRLQARRYGFNEEEYISALKAVPRLSREAVDTAMAFFVQFADMISKLSYSNFSLARSLGERDALLDSLRKSEKTVRLNRLYSVLSKINEAIVRIREPQKLFEEACRIAVEEGQFRMAWIGLADHDTKLIKVVAKYGDDEGYLDSVRISIDKDTPEGRGPTGIALREGRVYVNNDTENNPAMKPWRDEQLKRGYKASASFPFMVENQTIGVITLYANKPNYFDEEEIQLLQSLADDVSFAIESADIERQRSQAVEELRRARDELEVRVRERTADLETMHEIITEELARTQLLQDVAIAATTSPDIHTVSNRILQALNEHIHLKTGLFYQFNEKKQLFCILSHLNCTQDAISKIKELPLTSQELLGPKAVQADKILTHKEDTASPERVALLKQVGAWDTRYAVIPIKYRGKVTGIIALIFEGKRDFTQEEFALFDSIAHIVGQAIENARLYEAEKKRAEELVEHRKNLEKTIQKRTREICEINARLSQSEAQHRQIIEASPDAYFVFARNKILYANSAALQLFGCKKTEEIDITTLNNLITPENYKKIKNLKGSRKPVHLGELTIGKEAFLPKTVEVSVIPVVFEGATAKQYIVRDITQRKEIEKEIARLDRLNLIGEMAAGIGHEVRNPMTSVRGFLQLLANKELDPKKLEYYVIMIEELDRANSIITEFLSLAKDRAVKLTPTSLNNIINSLYPLLSTDATKQDKWIMLKKGEIPNLLLNEKEIRQLIINLVRNGLEAMPTGGGLTIGTYDEKDEVVLYIEDEGTGIKPEIFDKLGTPFVTTKSHGTGLGLSVCYSIAAKHNAKIDFKTGLAGTTFYVRFKKKEGA